MFKLSVCFQSVSCFFFLQVIGMKIEDEGRVNMEIESYLRTHTDVRRQLLRVVQQALRLD